MRRKLLSAAAAVICGIVYLDGFSAHPAAFLLLTAGSAAAFFLFVRRSRSAVSFLKIFGCGFAAGCLLLAAADYRAAKSPLQEYQGREAVLTASVLEAEEQDENKFRLVCRIEGEKVLCSYYRDLENWWNLIGKEISFRAVLEKPRGAANPRTFDYRRYLQSEDIRYTAVIDTFSVRETKVSVFDRCRRFILAGRCRFLEALRLPEDSRAVIEGVLFGADSGIEEETLAEFRRNGTAHVLAVSGLHVGILYSIYRQIYKRKKSLFLTAAFAGLLFLYGTAALWSVSVTRASVLVLLSMGADLLHRRYDLSTALAAAALFAILENPYVIFGASFQMSFLAVLSMSFLTPVFQKYAGENFGPVFAVQAGLMPYIAYTFNYVSLISIVCNIPVVYLISILVPCGTGLFFLYLLTESLAPAGSALLGGLADLTTSVNRFFAAGDVLVFDVVSPPLWILVSFYLALFFAASELGRVIAERKDFGSLKGLALALCLAAGLSFFAGSSPFDKADLLFLDVGQGDSVHIKGTEGRHILIDGGGNIRYNVGEKTLKPYFLKNGIGSLDLAAATHLHTDHYLGLSQLAETFPVEQMVTQGKAGEKLFLGQNRWIEILWPPERNPDTEDENLNSLIFKVHMDGVTALLTGDITAEGEQMLIERYKGTDVLQADILKIAHHGSGYSTCDAFLEAVRPSVAVISVGKNTYGHPSNLIIEKLRNSGIIIYRTDRDGAVGIINRRGKITVCTENP